MHKVKFIDIINDLLKKTIIKILRLGFLIAVLILKKTVWLTFI